VYSKLLKSKNSLNDNGNISYGMVLPLRLVAISLLNNFAELPVRNIFCEIESYILLTNFSQSFIS